MYKFHKQHVISNLEFHKNKIFISIYEHNICELKQLWKIMIYFRFYKKFKFRIFRYTNSIRISDAYLCIRKKAQKTDYNRKKAFGKKQWKRNDRRVLTNAQYMYIYTHTHKWKKCFENN